MLPENAVMPDGAASWRRWLAENHQRDTGVWLVVFKKSTGKQKLSFDDAIDEALCFGWIDSKPRKLDDERTMLWFAPRKPKTGWSRINKAKIARLSRDGRMAPAGKAKVAAAIDDGSWTLLDAVENLEIPEDLATAFEAHPGSRQNFDAFPRSTKRGILEWILQAKRAATRQKRVVETAELAARNERANQWTRS